METTHNNIRLLVVDDEPDIREILQFNLENEGYAVDLAESAEEALTILTPKHRLILLDVMMGGMSGFQLANQLRKEGNKVPIIFLTAKDKENDLLTGFSVGGDDYIFKPFSLKEVAARIKSVLKRTGGEKAEPEKQVWTIDTLQVDENTLTVTIDGEVVDLTKTEFNILLLLVQHVGRVYSRAEILQKAWQDEGIVLERTVDVHIARLRKKLGCYAHNIVNRSGYGYVFNLR